MWLAMLANAGAHVGATLEGIDLVFPGPSLDANFGLLASPDGATFSWICHETITAKGAIISPRYAHNAQGVWLVTVPTLAQVRDAGEPVYRSTDACDWWPVEGLEDRTVSRVAFDPFDDTVAYALTADLSEGLYNAVFRSADGGQTFTALAGVGGVERLLRSVVFDPARPGHVWVSAVWYGDDKVGGSAWLYISEDGGLTWIERPVPLPSDSGPVTYDVDVVAVQDGVAWLVVGPYGDDLLWRTDDGGLTFSTALEAEGDLIDGAIDADGNLWLTASQQRLYLSTDGGEHFSLVEQPPGGLGVGVDAQGTLWATGFAQFTGEAVYHQADNRRNTAFELVLHLSQLQPPPSTCPAESHVAVACGPLWAGLAARLPQPFVDTGEPSEEGGAAGDSGADGAAACGGCGVRPATGGLAGGGTILWVLWAQRRRRR